MKVLIIPYNYPTVENCQKAVFIADQVQMLREHRHDVTVLGVIPKTLSDILESQSLKFGNLSNEEFLLSLPALRGLDRFNNFLQLNVGKALFRKLLKLKGKPDVIHVHNASCATLALWIKRNFDIPFVITEHSSLKWNHLCNKSFNLYKESKANIAVSEKFAAHLSSEYDQYFHYIPNVVDTNYFCPPQIQYDNDVKQDGDIITFISIGNLTKNKNHQLAIQAFKELRLKNSNIRLMIVGDGSEKNNLKRQIKELNIYNSVTLLGRQSRKNIRNLLWDADFFILPSISETFGVVLIEAMAAGLPVLSLKNGGSESIIKKEVGFLADNEESFVGFMGKLLVRKFRKKEIIEYTTSNFSPYVVCNLLEKIYAGKG